jgi:uncharacterized membrane protein YjdF
VPLSDNVIVPIGAHFTYSLVPYDRWLQNLTGTDLTTFIGTQRNHYDRVAHFLYGALLVPPSVELFARFAPPRGVWFWLMPVLFLVRAFTKSFSLKCRSCPSQPSGLNRGQHAVGLSLPS